MFHVERAVSTYVSEQMNSMPDVFFPTPVHYANHLVHAAPSKTVLQLYAKVAKNLF